MNYSCFYQLLRNPALPKEQVLSWTQEREERQNREGRRRGAAALVHPQSPEIVTDWNHRVRDKPLTQQTHPKHWCTLSVFSPLHLFKSAGKHAHTRCCSALLQLSAGGLCLFGTSLSLSGSITQGLHNVPYHFHPIHLSVTFSAASGYASHNTPPSRQDLM